ncbi:MAG TPA: ATP-binding protein [Patescibacteria group bacterium]|nr:ATP-binding protein [Patescibacteria group bacterium]
MAKIQPLKPFILLLYGYPGTGKTYFARQLSDHVNAAHLQGDRIRSELFEKPRYDKQENTVISQILKYLCEEFLSAGVSVIYDINALRLSQRRALYDLAYRNHAASQLIWFQMDADSAFARNQQRDRRRADDKYAAQWDRTSFESVISQMQNPNSSEEYIVVSGKHLFNMQLNTVLTKLRNKGVLSTLDANDKVIKPGMVNLVPPNQGRVDLTRRNISIRS